MNPERWKLVKQIFDDLCELPMKDWPTALDEACGTDKKVRALVLQMLREWKGSRTEKRAEFGEGEEIGPYKIEREIGRGGMGVVYLAQQVAPVSRRVALKVIKLGMDSRDVLRRFASERQSLAMMQHPCIAQIYDAGTTGDGRPYFAMEYVDGLPITHFCDKHKMGIRDRLDLFLRVCDAAQHAHQKGVIHRDLKPSNVLIQTTGERHIPKIIDFGIAKAMDRQALDQTLFTQQGILIGTPSYMSPEQAEMKGDVDARTDIYSLGVVLYELLVGQLPIDPRRLRSAAFDEMRRIIREEMPPRPTACLSSQGPKSADTANTRSTNPSVLARRLRQDLDWITMKALRKERSERYPSPSELASDIRRYLESEPVVARPPAVSYRLRKFLARNTLSVSAVGFVTLLILIGLASSTWLYLRAEARLSNLYREQGRLELQKGRPLRSAVYLLEAYRRNPEDVTTRFLLQRALQPIEAQELTFGDGTLTARSGVFAPDGSRVLTSGYRRDPGTARTAITLDLWDETDGTHLYRKDLDNVRLFLEPNGTTVLTTDRAGTRLVTIWTVEDGIKQAVEIPLRDSVYEPDPPPIGRPLLSPDQSKILLAKVSEAQVLDLSAPGKPVYLQGKILPWREFAFDPTGALLAGVLHSGRSKESLLSLWETSTGRLLFSWVIPSSIPLVDGIGLDTQCMVQFSSDSQMLMTATGGHVAIVDPSTGQMKRLIANATGTVLCARLDPIGSRLVIVGDKQASSIWTLSPDAGDATIPLDGFEGRLTGAVFDPSGLRIATVGDDGLIRLWDATTGKILAEFAGHGGPVGSVGFNPDGSKIISAGKDGTVRVWSAEPKLGPRLTLNSLRDPIASASFSPDGTKILTVSSRLGHLPGCDPRSRTFITPSPGMDAKLWDARTGTPLVSLNARSGVQAAMFSPTGDRVLTLSSDFPRLWNIEGELIHSLPGHAKEVTFGTFSPDGSLLITTSPDKTTKVWSTVTGQLLETLDDETFPVLTLGFRSDGSRILTSSRRLRIWDEEPHDLWTTLGSGDESRGAVLGPHGRLLATIDADGSAHLWDLGKLARIGTIGKGLRDIVFSPSGSRIVTTGFSEAPEVWDVATGSRLARLEAHAGDVFSVRFSADGNLITTAGKDATVGLWNARTSQPLTLLEGHTATVACSAFNPAGTSVISVDVNGIAMIWDIALESRTLAQIDQVVQGHVPLRLRDGVIVSKGR